MSVFFRRFFAVSGCCGLLAVFSSGARAELLDELAAQAAAYPLVRAEFVQTKRMAAMKRPLLTRGRLTFLRGRGVLWQIEQPYRVTYVLGESRIVEIGEDGARRAREARDMPGLAQVGRIFQAMLGANTEALREHFELAARGEEKREGEKDARRWTLELKPRQAPLAQFLDGLRLSGARFVEEIQIDEAGGDSTQILLRDSQGAETPTGDEARLFDGR
jgi:hypothetical protein